MIEHLCNSRKLVMVDSFAAKVKLKSSLHM